MSKHAKSFLAIFLLVIVVPLVLMAVDAVTPKECTVQPQPGAEIAIPGERMMLRSISLEQVVFDVTRDPFSAAYELDPAHGHLHPQQPISSTCSGFW
jgi:hypothetical protein